jgi:dihydrofolate synthase / folylpolyglutamate synthase
MVLDTYPEALEYLFSTTDYEKMQHARYNADTFSLDRMRRLMARLGSPEQALRSIHIAGTKGKGSTAAMIHALALHCGLKVGLYTSPHLVDLRERIRVGRDDISPEDLRRLIWGARMHIERMKAEGDAPTFFEILTGLAMRHFVDIKVDLAVMEVGLGGRLDATNVLVPDVGVITAISFDHMAQLGDTLAAIAAEKAGIIKSRVAVVTQPQADEVMDVIEDACRKAGSPLIRVGRDVTYRWEPVCDASRCGGMLSVQMPGATYDDLFIPLMGEHQALNACAAIAAARRVAPMAGRLQPKIVREALAAVRWPGRMELVRGTPDLLLDGAHNRASMECLAEGVACHYPGRRVVVVFGAAADKDLDGMMEAVADKMPAAAMLFTRTSTARAADPADLAARFVKAGGGGGAQTAPDVAAALKTAVGLAGTDGLVVFCGSLYLVGEVKKLLASMPRPRTRV